MGAGTQVGRDSMSELTFRKPSAAVADKQCYVNDDGWSSGRHAKKEEERKPIEHTYNFLDDQTEGTACLQEVCVKLDPNAVDTGPVEPPTHTYNFLDDHTEGVNLDPHAVQEFVPPTHTYSFLDDHTEGVGCLENTCVELDPHAVTGVLDAAKPTEPPTHTYSFLDDATEGVDLLPTELININNPPEETKDSSPSTFIPPSHTYSFLDDHTEGLDLDPHAVKEFVPPTHTYSFLDDHTEGVGCLENTCVKLDPHAVTGV